ncbi:MAG: hypothetical protein GX862_08105, partial [Leucobacter sp.]|nr:hypothetical protein [Leucobacter sp.]
MISFFTEPMLDLDFDVAMTFPADYDFAAQGPSKAEEFSWAFSIYLDPLLTRVSGLFVFQDSPGSDLRIRPLETSVASIDGRYVDLMPKSEGGRGWGLQPEYYLVRKIDEHGHALETPVVTKISAKRQLDRPVVSAEIDRSNGTQNMNWSEVPGADRYVIIGSTGVVSDVGEYRRYEVLGETSGTEWNSTHLTEAGVANQYPSVQNAGLQLYDGDSSDDMMGSPGWSFYVEGIGRYEQSGFAWGVIAAGGDNYSHMGEVDASSLAGPLPQHIASNAMRDLGFFTTLGSLDQVPRKFAFTGLDGVTRLTQARIPEDGITTEDNEWVIRVEGVGTMLGTEARVRFFNTEQPDMAAFIEQFNAEAQALAPTTGLADFAVISGSPEELSAEFAHASEPATTAFPVYGTDEYVKFVAGHLIAGSECIDVTEFQSVPGVQTFEDAYYEAYYQN